MRESHSANPGEGETPTLSAVGLDLARAGRGRGFGQMLRRHFAPVLAAVYFTLACLAALAAPWLSSTAAAQWLPPAATHPPDAFVSAPFQRPNQTHWFGTDAHGRDVFSRVLRGTRISLFAGGLGALVSLIVGVLWGATAGYLGGRWDGIMMRFVDILYSLPSIVFIVVLMTAVELPLRDWAVRHWGPSVSGTVRLVLLFVGLGAISWLTMARIVRGQVLTLKTRGYVEASRALGASHVRILWCHLLPNIAGVILVYLTLMVPSIILYESFLSYLGLGIQPPQASLGSLLAEGAGHINPIRIYWWMIVGPGTVLVSLLLALNVLGDGLRDALERR
jgi:oligopeptide transport system permease protein